MELLQGQLSQERAHVQGISPGVAVKALSLLVRQFETGPCRQGRHVARAQRLEQNAAAALLVETQPVPAIADVGPAGDDDDDPVLVETLHRRQEGLAGKNVGPMEVLDHHRERSVVLKACPGLQQFHGGSERAVRAHLAQLSRHVKRHVGSELVGLGARHPKAGRQGSGGLRQ